MADSMHVVCPNCQARNRLPRQRLEDKPKCGACHQALFSAQALEADAAVFERQLMGNDIPVLVDFWAPWCGPCKMMGPQFARAAQELEPGMRLLKLNTEDEQAVASRFGIRSIPTMILFKQGQPVGKQSGAMNAPDIVRWARSLVS